MQKFSNNLILESSPYLLQHAHNPVNWYPWGEEALNKSKAEDKLILISIGYSACHWCHVMEHESFENEEIAQIMNENFVNIKIDREERPDLDQIYMDAVQAISGNGGWPLNVFLTPDLKPFFGGTYFPPENSGRRVGWPDILLQISSLWNTKKQDILDQAENLFNHLESTGNIFKTQIADDSSFTKEGFESINNIILESADKINGGFGKAPKFLQTFTIQYLQMHSHFFKNENSLKQAELSLTKMVTAGIYDHLAGGISRYSTDEIWLAPHFEKMLYDNALLVITLSEGYMLKANPLFKESIIKTIAFLKSEMKNSEGGFYSALDADSEKEEGKFYVWSKFEINNILKDDSELFCKYYGVTEEGNWEGKNILTRNFTDEEFAINENISTDILKEKINNLDLKLLKIRNERIRPGIDDKILLGWNALLVKALCKASSALEIDEYKVEAIDLFSFLDLNLKTNKGELLHTYKNGNASISAFLDDYAYFIDAAINLYEVTGDDKYLYKAKDLLEYTIKTFSAESGLFYFTSQDQTDVIVRKIDCYDGAVPSANSILTDSLFYLSVCFENKDWELRAEKNINSIKNFILKYPTSFGVWAQIALKKYIGIKEIAIVGQAFNIMLAKVLKIYLPNKILLANIGKRNLIFSLGEIKNETLVYICKDNHCLPPMRSLQELENHLSEI
ncbi:MAG: thioredoxin domain-containing protein [Ferruginibacter sp.]